MKRIKKYAKEGHLARKLQSTAAIAAFEKIIIGSLIKKARKMRRLNQKNLAQKIKTSQSAVARIEVGKQNLSIETLTSIALALDFRLDIRFLNAWPKIKNTEHS